MIFYLKKVPKLIEKNLEIGFFFLLIIFTVISITFYNSSKKIISENYKHTINNIYFKKTINHIFDNLAPRYRITNHKILNGETFDKILNKYSIQTDEIIEIKKNLTSEYDLNNLKTNLNIKFKIDQSNNKKIVFFVFPISRTEKIHLSRNLDTNLFEKKTIITNLNKKIIFK